MQNFKKIETCTEPCAVQNYGIALMRYSCHGFGVKRFQIKTGKVSSWPCILSTLRHVFHRIGTISSPTHKVKGSLFTQGIHGMTLTNWLSKKSLYCLQKRIDIYSFIQIFNKI